jgi:cytochrome c oxidase subunit 3
MEANAIQQMEDTTSEPIAKGKAVNLLLWLGQVSIGMLFAGLTSGYIVRRETGNWLKFELPPQFWASTAIILISSITMNWAMQSVKKGNTKNLTQAVLATFLLGVAFIICQVMAWAALTKANIVVMGSQSYASGSYLYIISGLHIAHILGGLLALLIVFFKARAEKYSPQNYAGVKLCATYWHFLDGLWIYLFIFLLIMR